MFSDNIQYKFTEDWMIDLLESSSKPIAAIIYTRRKLIELIEVKIELTQFDKNPQIKRTNKLVGVKEMALNLNELDNTDNLEDGRLSNTLVTYHVTGSDDFMRFEPVAHQYKKNKNGELNFLTPRITDQNKNIMTDGPVTTVVLHI